MYWIKSPKQSGIKCGVGSHRHFLAHNAESRFFDKKCRILTFHNKKCCIPAFRDKTLLNTVLPCYCNSLVSRSLSLSNALWAVSKGPRALWAISLSRVRPELRDWLTRPLLGSERRSCVPAPYATLIKVNKYDLVESTIIWNVYWGHFVPFQLIPVKYFPRHEGSVKWDKISGNAVFF